MMAAADPCIGLKAEPTAIDCISVQEAESQLSGKLSNFMCTDAQDEVHRAAELRSVPFLGMKEMKYSKKLCFIKTKLHL